MGTQSALICHCAAEKPTMTGRAEGHRGRECDRQAGTVMSPQKPPKVCILVYISLLPLLLRPQTKPKRTGSEQLCYVTKAEASAV